MGLQHVPISIQVTSKAEDLVTLFLGLYKGFCRIEVRITFSLLKTVSGRVKRRSEGPWERS